MRASLLKPVLAIIPLPLVVVTIRMLGLISSKIIGCGNALRSFDGELLL
jgi:hypothetical protein